MRAAGVVHPISFGRRGPDELSGASGDHPLPTDDGSVPVKDFTIGCA